MCMTMYLTRDAPYTTLSLVENFSGSTAFDMQAQALVGGGDRQAWELNGIMPCGRCTGVSQFLTLSVLAIGRWEQGWKSALDAIDRVVMVDVGASVGSIRV